MLKNRTDKIRLLNSLIVSFFFGCGSDDSGSQYGPPFLPMIARTIPENGSRVNPRQKIIITFQGSMDTGTLKLGGLMGLESNTGIWQKTNYPNDTITLAPVESWSEGEGRSFIIECGEIDSYVMGILSLSFDVDATAPAIRQDLDKANPGRPWRILHMNRAIVATRTHQPDVMDEAFTVLTEHLPEDAAGFFSQGMEQMDLLNYPPHVREVMDRYYRKWSVNRSLH